MLHSDLTLHVQDHALYVVARSNPPQTLCINRITGEKSVQATAEPPVQYGSKKIRIYGVLGLITLLRSEYLIVITEAPKVTTILGNNIFFAKDFAVYPISPLSVGSLLASPAEKYLLGLLKAHLYEADKFYFSYSYDITTRMQAQKETQDVWQTADDRFFWNKYLQLPLIELTKGALSPSKFILPVILGFSPKDVKFTTLTLISRRVTFGLVTRRSRYRAGTRYFSRGVDEQGNVSNFNETEMITLIDSAKSLSNQPTTLRYSHVQTRGSVPLVWAEINDLRYKPELRIVETQATQDACRQHFESLVGIYGDQYIVNLVNEKGHELPIKQAFERAVQSLGNPRIHYTYFNFHHYTKGLRFDRVSVLLDSLAEAFASQGFYFSNGPSFGPKSLQSSTFRTNCMDSLDRTNVVQSAFAKSVLNAELRHAGVLSSTDNVENHGGFMFTFRNLWADNADVVSRAYSGTGALKTDFTRTGKRGMQGNLQDGWNSCVRYVKNNFWDGQRQDAYDLVTGAWQPRDTKDFLLDNRSFVIRTMPTVLVVAFLVLLLSFCVPIIISEWIVSSRTLFWAAMATAILAYLFIRQNGILYVAWPRLNKLDKTRTYPKPIAHSSRPKRDGAYEGEFGHYQKERVD